MILQPIRLYEGLQPAARLQLMVRLANAVAALLSTMLNEVARPRALLAEAAFEDAAIELVVLAADVVVLVAVVLRHARLVVPKHVIPAQTTALAV